MITGLLCFWADHIGLKGHLFKTDIEKIESLHPHKTRDKDMNVSQLAPTRNGENQWK